MKVGKESIIGLYAAVKRFMSLDEEEERLRTLEISDQICNDLEAISALAVTRLDANCLSFSYDYESLGMPYAEFGRRLLQGEPSVLLGARSAGIFIYTEMLESKDIRPILDRIQAVLADR